jgi:hypothetical protein
MLPAQSRNRWKQTGRRARKSARRSGCPLVKKFVEKTFLQNRQ